MIKEKLKAAAIHGFISLLVGLFAAFIVFYIWYPAPLDKMSKGANLFLLVFGVELCLGPLMSLVIYNSNKPKSELVKDYCIVGVVQLAALFYGLYSVALSRPAYLVFYKDRVDVISAIEITKVDLSNAATPYNSLPWFGPKWVCIEEPTNSSEKNDLLFSALDGKDAQYFPKYYRECIEGEILGGAYDRAVALETKTLDEKMIDNVVSTPDYKWLPFISRFENWVLVYPNGDENKPTYINEDPFR